MQRTTAARHVLGLLSCLMILGRIASAADWPAYRANSGRTAKTSEKLTYPLKPMWKYVPARPPQPAWPDPFLGQVAGMDFDYAPQAAIVGGLIYYGSTTDNTLRALDGPKWGFTTGGPIRFAPAIWDGKAYLVSDDGYAYCLDATTGKLIWKFYGGLYDSRFIANGRMASRWLIRSGVVVDDGMVNFAVGMWTSEGVYVYALDAKTGEELWVNDANQLLMRSTHGASNYRGNMPQGYAAASKSIIAFGNGQASVWPYDRQTGKGKGLVDNLGEGKRNTSTVVAIRDDGTIYHGCKAGHKGL